MADTTEREIKLGAPASFTIPELSGLGDGLTAAPMAVRKLDATYYDTVDLRLARWGVSCRYRSGDGTGWTVKLPEGDDGPALVRRELTFPGPPTAVPAEVSSLVRAFVRSGEVQQVARLRTSRAGIELRDSEGQRVAEVVDDQVTVHEGRRIIDRFREIEAELTPEAPDSLLDTIVEVLRDAGAGDPDKTSKVVRALGERAQAPPELVPVALSKKSSTAELIQAAMAASVIRIIRHDPGVRIGDDPEDVHQARVGARRLRSDLRTFRAFLSADWVGPLRDELRWLGGLLGGVRDADVLLHRLRRQTAALPDRDAAGVAALVRKLAAQREAARAELLEAMDSPRYVELLDRLVAEAQAPRLLPDADVPAAEAAPDLVRRPWGHLEKAVAALEVDPPNEALHEVRIRAKRCRYAAEAVVPVIGKPARTFAAAVEEIQGVLGEHQDAVVAEAWLREAATRAGAAQALVAGELITVEREEALLQRDAWQAAWKQASKKKLRAWMT